MVKCLIFITIICKLAVSHGSLKKSLNVGSVLFAPGDADKELWTLQSVELLKARKHFQKMLVPLLLVSQPLNDETLTNILKYLNNVYAHVNQASSDQGTKSLMTAAVSDVIGGFLKFYVLPVTKYAFYGGVVSPNNLEKLNKMYKNILNHLNTDGSGWREPDQYMLDNIVIDVASPLWFKINRYPKLDPCKKLGYFEKTINGLVIPMPNINWNENSYTMFLPLKNESLVSLMSIDALKLLIIYYNAATECAAVYSLDRKEEFEEKFQTWLIRDVVPHLSDDIMYPGLGGVLSLMNIGRLNDIDSKDITNSRGILQQVAMTCGLKVTQIQKLLLILIVVWICIPASIFLYCQRKFKKSNRNIKRSSGHSSKKASENTSWNVETFAKTTVSKNIKKYKKSTQNNTDPIKTNNEGVMAKLRKDTRSCTYFKPKEKYQRLSYLESYPPSDESFPTTCLDISQRQSHYTTPCSRTLGMIEESQHSFVQNTNLDLLELYNDCRGSYTIDPSRTVTLFQSERERPHRYSHCSFSRTVSDNLEAEAALIHAELITDIHSSSRRLNEKVKNPFLSCINEVENQSAHSSLAETSASDKTSILTSRHQFPLLPKPTVQICLHTPQTEKPLTSEEPPKSVIVDVTLENRTIRQSRIPKWSPPVNVSTPRSKPVAAAAKPLNKTSTKPRPLPKSKLPLPRIQDDTAIKTPPRKKAKLNVTL